MPGFLRDLRYAVRGFARSPLFTVTVVLTLALGTGVDSAIFGIVDAVLLRPLPFPESERLVMVWETERAQDARQVVVSPADFFDWRDQSRSFEGLAAYHRWSFSLTGAGEPARVSGACVTGAFFGVLGIEPMLGRDFRPEEDRPGGDPVVLLSHGLWQERFGGDPRVVGTAIQLDGQALAVVGVMPPGMILPEGAELWTPRGDSPESAPRGFQFLQVVGRLAPGATLEGARAEMDGIASRLARSYPDTNAGRGTNLVPLHEQLLGDVRPALLVLFASVALVLAIACANVAILLLARGAARRPEAALRLALGAGRGRLVRQMLEESLLLALAGGALGVAVAHGAMRLLVWLSPQRLPRLEEVSLDGRVLAFTLATSLLVGLFLAVVAALQSARLERLPGLRSGGSRGAGPRVRQGFVIAEVAVSLALLIAAGLLIRSFVRLRGVETGFDSEDLLTAWIALPQTSYPQPSDADAFFAELLQRVAALPGVESAALALSVPMARGMDPDNRFTIDGRPPAAPGEESTVKLRPVSAGFFRTLGMRRVEGRSFDERDRAGAPGVVIVNEAMARRFWPGRRVVGERITVGVELGSVGRLEPASREIVGVVGDVKHGRLDAEAQPECYFPIEQSTWWMSSLVLRTTVEPASLAGAVRAAVWEIDADLPVSRLATLESLLGESVAQPRFLALVSGTFAGLAALLALLGLYGVVSFTVGLRRHELSIRMVLGASGREVRRLVVRQGLVLVGIGVAGGFALTLLATPLLASLLFGVSATDPATLIGVSGLLSSVALLACDLPARRASRMEPAALLRAE